MDTPPSEINVVDDSDDSDIQEIAVIPAPILDVVNVSRQQQSQQSLKRRKSSPLLDPIPTYTSADTDTAWLAPTSTTLIPASTPVQSPGKRKYESDYESSTSYAEEPVMWTPKPPTRIPSPTPAKSSNAPRQRVAHKPTVQKNKKGQPKNPIGISKKVPHSVRVKYLDAIIKEYLNSGHPEDECYSEALKEEQSLASRAANKSIYMNLVASLKKKIREKAGVATHNEEDPKYVDGNKVVSHDQILTGKVKGTFSIERKRKSSDPRELGGYELYDKLKRYIMPKNQIELYGYPCPDPSNKNMRLPPKGKDNQVIKLRSELANSYTCGRCNKIYRVDENGLQLPDTGKCIFHAGHLWNERINKSLEKRYSCCKNDASDAGCSSNPYHVHKGEYERANYEGYVITRDKPELEPNKFGIFALDCEMCYTTYGFELTRVTVIDHKTNVIYEELVKPDNLILDYNTRYSGIKEGDLTNVTKTLKDVQEDLLKIFSSKTILIGHSLDSDMKALKIFHSTFIDTAQLFPHKRGLPYKRALRTLMVENLKMIIQEDSGHDSKEDATAAFNLVMWKAKTDVPEEAN